jgi:hypothetical protein
MAGNATRFVSKHTNNTVEIIPQNANTKIPERLCLHQLV